MDILFLPFVAFIGFPWLALIPAALFLGIWWKQRFRLALVTGAAWLVYCLYEFLLKWRILCSGECNIRVDLLLIAPVLLALSVVTLVKAIRRR